MRIILYTITINYGVCKKVKGIIHVSIELILYCARQDDQWNLNLFDPLNITSKV